MTTVDKRMGFWLTTPNWQMAEMLANAGFKRIMLDVEHGHFGHETLHAFIPFLKGLGLKVYCKVLAPERSPIQSVLDFGADGVMIPHVKNLADAERLASYTKFPPKGDRSLAGGRAMGYADQTTEWFEETNQATRCYLMVETAGALEDVERIAALPCVDGLFPGPTDLALRRGRGMYSNNDEDRVDHSRIADAARDNDKALVFPAWSAVERKNAIANLDAEFVVSALETDFLGAAIEAFAENLKNE